jgi:small nuclear ribonucleoprotein D3
MTARDGRVSKLENVFLRGGNIKFIVLPELLKSSPMLKKVQQMKSKKLAEEKAMGGGMKGGMGKGAKRPKLNYDSEYF